MQKTPQGERAMQQAHSARRRDMRTRQTPANRRYPAKRTLRRSPSFRYPTAADPLAQATRLPLGLEGWVGWVWGGVGVGVGVGWGGGEGCGVGVSEEAAAVVPT